MAIRASGIGSGLDIESIVTQLVRAESQPLVNLDVKEQDLKLRLSAFGSLKSNLSGFNSSVTALSSLDKFKIFAATTSDETAVTATADSSGAVGTFDVTVTQLAQRNRVTSSAFVDSSTALANTGDLTIDVGGVAFTVTIDGTNNTLSGIRNAINLASDNTGVTASVLNEDGGSRLIIAANDSGTAKAASITSSNALTTELNLTEIDPVNDIAQDAIADINGFTVTRSNNTISDAIQGVTLELLTTGGTSRVDVSRDDTAIGASINTFAKAFNTLRGQLNGLRREGGTLEADSTILSINRDIDSVLNNRASITGVSFGFLAEIGLTRNKAGDFILDQSLLTKALDSDFDGVSKLLADDPGGFLARLDETVSGFTAFDGLVSARSKGIDSEISGLQEQRDRIEARIATVEKRLRSQFSALDGLVGQLRATGSFLSQQLSALPGFTRKQ